ncbi:MAG: hypothetical protein KBD37_05655 [Burkholderiales bacterium]|nr:hypothetical protein [Burkholderiales bacterium]
MNEIVLLNLINSFDALLTTYANDKNLLASNLDMHCNLCDLIQAMGYATLDRAVLEELFEFHLSDEGNGETKEEQLLSFILQFTHIGVNNNTLAKYKLNCNDYTKIYDVLSEKSKASFKNPQGKFDTTFVYEKTDVLPALLEHKILIEKE